MNVKQIVKPQVKEYFLYGEITSWNFRESITPINGKFGYRFTLYFSSGREKECEKSGFTTRQECLSAREITISELYNQNYVAFSVTVKEFMDFWLYYYMIDNEKISYNTFMSYRNVIYNYLIPHCGKMKMQQVTRDVILEVLNKISSSSVLRIAYGCISVTFGVAKVLRFISSSPVPSAIKTKKELIQKEKRLKEAATGKPIYKKLQRPSISLNQIVMLLWECKTRYPQLFIGLLLAVTTGLRISELIALKYTDVSYTKSELRVNKQLGKRLVIVEEIPLGQILTQELKPKTIAGNRTVPLASFVLDEIVVARDRYEFLKKSNPDFKDYEFIWCQDDGSPYHRGSYSKWYKPLLAELQEELELPLNLTWHDLRRSYTTILLGNQVSIKALSVAPGHSRKDFTVDVYVDNKKIIADGVPEMTDFINDVLPKENGVQVGIDDNLIDTLLPISVIQYT